MNIQHIVDPSIVDELGTINAQIAELQARAKTLKATVQAFVPAGEAIDGTLFRASHSVADRETVDWKAVAAKLKPSRQLVKAHTKVTEVHTIRVVGRIANAA
jgi:hypothetical protein